MRVVALCPVYNQAGILPALFASICRQTLPLTIVWSDDCSTDDSYAVLERLAATHAGPHHMLVRRNPENLGHARNLFAAMREHPADIYLEFDDDFSVPERASVQVAALAARPDWLLVGSAYQAVSADGSVRAGTQMFDSTPLDAASLARGPRDLVVAGHTFAWRGRLVEAFPPPSGRIGSGDFVLAFRAVLLGQMAFLPEVLVDYRQAGDSVSRTTLDHGDTLAAARAYYGHSARSWIGLGAQLARDLDHALRHLDLPAHLARGLKRRVVAHHQIGAALSVSAHSGSRWRWAFNALRALPVHGLTRSAARQLLLATFPGLFYGGRALLRKLRRR